MEGMPLTFRGSQHIRSIVKSLFMGKLSYPGFPDNWDSLGLPDFPGICNFPRTYEFAKFS
jgi:hypothetical protein